MDIKRELVNDQELVCTAQLASAYTLLALAPYDNWGHEGSPAEMAAYVVKTAKDRGHLGFVYDIVQGRLYGRL